MARYWAPVKDPNRPEPRLRSTITHSDVGMNWGQRPMFSEPGPDQPPPDQGAMLTAVRLDEVHPTDRREGADSVTEFAPAVIPPGIPFHLISAGTLSVPPTDAELNIAIGSDAQLGNAFIVRDGFGANLLWLVVKGGANTWWYERLTKAT